MFSESKLIQFKGKSVNLKYTITRDEFLYHKDVTGRIISLKSEELTILIMDEDPEIDVEYTRIEDITLINTQENERKRNCNKSFCGQRAFWHRSWKKQRRYCEMERRQVRVMGNEKNVRIRGHGRLFQISKRNM